MKLLPDARTVGPACVLALAAAAVAVGRPASAAAQADTLRAADTLVAQDGPYNRPFITSVRSTAIGGYVEANTNHFEEDGIGDGFSMEMRRFNIFVFGSISPRIRFISELEFEHGTEEIALETALLDVRINPSLVIRAGVLLPPIGYLNANHDSPQWNFVDRPLVTTEIIPSTLSEVGFGVFGKFFPGRYTVSYDLYLTNGLQDGILVNEEGRTHIPSGKSEELFAEDNNGSPAWTGRLGLQRPGWGEVGASFYTGIYNTYRIEGDAVDDERRVTIFAFDAQAEIRGVEVRTELALADIDVPSHLAELFGDRQWGGYLDVSVPVWRPHLAGYERPSVLALDLRLERLDMNVGTFSATGRNIFDETTAVVPGISFRPTSNTVFRANYRREWHRDMLGNPTAIRAGYQIGLATYF
ncbi:MAG: hypothetical protein D6701_03070 [Gemmatimonadetes bacterium]|nr:MAG: hypothetical protein D6701_03070 [Gemmatimonadota bacterium]